MLWSVTGSTIHEAVICKQAAKFYDCGLLHFAMQCVVNSALALHCAVNSCVVWAFSNLTTECRVVGDLCLGFSPGIQIAALVHTAQEPLQRKCSEYTVCCTEGYTVWWCTELLQLPWLRVLPPINVSSFHFWSLLLFSFLQHNWEEKYTLATIGQK